MKKSGNPILETLPRQLLSATPYALFAKKALTATSALTAATALNATTADSATTALTATNAVNATNATNATFATTALSANSATTALNATNATNAVNAATATNALNATNAVNAAHATTADAVAWGNVTGKPGGFNDDMDNDVLGALNCASGQVAKFNGTAWNCNADLTGGGPYNHFGESWSGSSPTPGLYVSNSGGGISILGSGGTGVQGQTALAYDGNGFAGVVGTNSGASCGATPPLGPFALDSHCIGGYFKAITSATGGIGAYGIGTMAGIVGEDGTGDGSGWGGYFLGGVYSQFVVTTSDARLKHAIQPLESQLPNVARLRPVTFEWNARPDGSHLGLIAQEVADIFPELVRTDPVAGYLTLNYDGLIPVLIKAMQEQQAEMAGLRASLSAEADETASSGEGRAVPVAVTALVVSLLGLRMRPQVRRQPRHN